MPYASSFNNDTNDNVTNHRPYHEVCGHVYVEVAKANIHILNKMLNECLTEFGDGRFEAMIGLLNNLGNCINLSQDSFAYGGAQARGSGAYFARRQVSFAFAKMRAKRSLTLQQYRANGRLHLTTDSIKAIQYTVEYENQNTCNGDDYINNNTPSKFINDVVLSFDKQKYICSVCIFIIELIHHSFINV